jgi:hypothetical protein
MKANDLLFRIKELVGEIHSKYPVLTDSNNVDNIQKIADITRLSSELHQRFIMLETMIHRESGFQNDQNAAMRNFLKELKQVVAIGKNEDQNKGQFIQFVQQEKKEILPIPEPLKTEPITIVAKPNAPVPEEKKPEVIISQQPEVTKALEVKNETPAPESAMVIKPVTLAINDRFRIMNELFSKQAHRLDENIKLFNASDKTKAHNHWLSLASEFKWDEEAEIVKTFKAVIFNRYV